MIGFVEDESLVGTQFFLAAPSLFDVLQIVWDTIGPYALLQKHTSEITEEDIEMSKEILNFYVGPVEELGLKHFDNFTKMMTDSFFWFGTHRFLDLHVGQALGKTYFYRFNYYGEHHYIGVPGFEHLPGVGHSDELYLQWNPLDYNEHPLNKEDAEVSLGLTTMWTNFVKYGDPTPPGDELGYTWDPVTRDTRRFLLIEQENKMDLGEDYQARMA